MSVMHYEVERVANVRDPNQAPDAVYAVIRTGPPVKLIAVYEYEHAADDVATKLNQWAGSQYNHP